MALVAAGVVSVLAITGLVAVAWRPPFAIERSGSPSGTGESRVYRRRTINLSGRSGVSYVPNVPAGAPVPPSAAPVPPSASPVPPAAESRVHRLRTTNPSGRSGVSYVPNLQAGAPVPLLVFLHGTGGSGNDGILTFGELAKDRGFAILAPDSGFSPDGAATWQVGDHPGEVTDDRRHVMACLAELLADGVALDPAHVLVVGHSGGGSSAPYVATNEPPFTAFAVLHGGAFPGGFGRRMVRGWFSTGQSDPFRPPALVARAYEEARSSGAACEMHLFEGGHAIGEEERRAVVRWWLGG